MCRLCRSWCWTRRRRHWTPRQRHKYMTQYNRRSPTVHSLSLLTQSVLYCSVTVYLSSTPDRYQTPLVFLTLSVRMSVFLQRGSIAYDAERCTTRVPKKVHFIFAYNIDIILSMYLHTVWHTYTTISLQQGDYSNPPYTACVAALPCKMRDQQCTTKTH